MGYLCDSHPDTPGALLITNLDTGDTAVCCGHCVHPWAAAIAAATAPDTVDDPIALEPSDPITGDPTHDDDAGAAGTSPEPVAPVSSPAPEPDPTSDDDGDDLPELADLVAGRPGHLSDVEEPATSDA